MKGSLEVESHHNIEFWADSVPLPAVSSMFSWKHVFLVCVLFCTDACERHVYSILFCGFRYAFFPIDLYLFIQEGILVRLLSEIL